MPKIQRRDFLIRTVQLTAVAGIATRWSSPADAGCVDPESESLRESLNYAEAAPDPAQACSGCAFFSAESTDASCGNCTILSGPADAAGHCDSWSAPG